jgi:hypothetical protein
VMRLRLTRPHTLLLLAILAGFMGGARAQESGMSRSGSPWTLEVLYRTSLPLFEGGERTPVEDGGYRVNWLAPVATGYGIRLRRQIGRNWQCAFGLVPTRRRYTADISWTIDSLAGPSASPDFEAQLDWVVASYGVPIIFRTEVPLSEKVKLGAGGGVNFELFPSDAYTSGFDAADSAQFTFDQYTQRVSWFRTAIAVELGCVFELSDGSGFHVGIQVQRALGRWFRAESYGRHETEISHVKSYLNGHHWGLDLRFILP